MRCKYPRTVAFVLHGRRIGSNCLHIKAGTFFHRGFEEGHIVETVVFSTFFIQLREALANFSTAMVSTALVSFTMRYINDGKFSFIHILSALTLFVCYKLVRNARAHNPIAHRREVRGIVMGALMIAGFFTFQFDRLMARWLMGLPALN
jgi:uncharacterized membrane protein YedE/YeeE